jgi:lytic murein transglycosylase
MALPAAAAPCGGDFDAWLTGLKDEAAAQGVSQQTIQSSLADVTFDPNIIAHDHAQGVFHQTFEQFSGRMVPPRLAKAKKMLKQYAPIFARVEQEYGVPGPVIVAIWGLETDFGANSGKFATIRSLATLAFDCRRPDKFRPEVIAALQIVDRGDMNPADMHGAWAGEIGQTQFLPSSYLKYAVDYDGSGHARLHGQLSQGLWLAGRPALGRRHGQFRRAAEMERFESLHQDRGVFRRAARRHAVKRAQERHALGL